MDIIELCNSQSDVLVDRWVNRFFASYPLDSKGFMRTNRDRFANDAGLLKKFRNFVNATAPCRLYR